MRFARGLLIFSYGLFTIAAQALLFREFITTFEGSDISVGIFFGSWFLWVGLGALLVYRAKTFAKKLLTNIEFLFLCYLPAFIVELILIIQARELAGIESYVLLSIKAILLLSIVVNAPVSIITGMLFPIACRWVQREDELAVSRVYIIEAAGSFLGGLGTTLLLGVGVSSARIFFILAFVLSSSVFVVRLAKGLAQNTKAEGEEGVRRLVPNAIYFLLPFCVLFCLAFGADKALMRYVRIVKWTKLLPEEALIGSFRTAQAEYLYGIYHGQWVAVREGSVCEALPNESSTGRIAAIGLCQNPDAKRILVVGSGLGLCHEFLRLPQIECVTWAHCDSEYVREVDRFIPPEFKVSDERFRRLSGDVRSLLSKERQYYDLVILNLPDATSSVLNRYYTLEFYRQIKEALRPGGVLGIRIAGGENIMGTELINLGASTKLTLEKVFSQLVLTPGEDTWFIASDSGKLTGDPGSLRDRFATIKGGAGVFPPEALLSVYLPDRAAAALENYSGADLPESLLINRDSRPLTHLYSLLLAAKQSGAPGTKFVKYLVLAGLLAFVVPILVFIVLRAIYILRKGSLGLKTVQQGNASSFDSSFLVFSTGWAGIGVMIVLMYLYQTYFGSLYLYIGIISSVFMAGLTGGAVLIRHLLLGRRSIQPQILLFAAILVHTLILAAIIFWPGEQWTHRSFTVAFFLCGLCTGSYFPLAARQLADSAFESGEAGSKLETADHIGASAGGLLTSLALVPVLGTKVTLFVFALLILANIPPAVMRLYKPGKVCSLTTTTFKLRRLGYILFGIGLSVILCSNLLAKAGVELRPSLPQHAVQALAGELKIEQESKVLSEGARKINYFRVCDANDKLNGYIFSSEDLAPEVSGFGGKMNLAIYVDATGRLINFHILWSNETPSYLELLSQWRGLLGKHQLFQHKPFADIDAVTGATISSKAVLSALEKSGYRFAGEILGQVQQSGTVEEKVSRAGYLPDINGIYLIGAFVLSFIVIYRGGFWSRLATLCFNLVVGGIILNAQYSSEQIATVLSLHSPAIGLSGAFLLVVGIPLLVIIFGNIYCGYICPFGVVQELLGYVVPRRFKPATSQIPVESIQKAGFVKYVVLFVLIMVFFVSRNRTTLAADPLIGVFSRSSALYTVSVSLIIAVALTGSIFYTRFWCRYLCPVGALLSLPNNVTILNRFLPAKRFGRCEFGLTVKDHTDCLYCDRCRYQTKDQKPKTEDLGIKSYVPGAASYLSRHLVAVAILVGIFVSTVSVNRFLQVIPAGLSQPVVSASGAGQPRDVDLQRIRTMIQQGKLSDKKAEFYKKAD
jgi:spermidine synthase